MRSGTQTGALTGLRVLDLSTVFAAPYIGGLMSDMGAEVIKIEPPARLDQTRGGGFGPYLDNDPGEDGWNWSGAFHSLNRGKMALVLDLKQEKGRNILLRLIPSADVLLENFTPRVMRGWGITYAELSLLNPRLIMLSNTGYGSSGPWSSFKAQGTTLEATMGLTNYSGYDGGRPKKVVQSYPDFLAAWTGLVALHAAILDRKATGRGRWIDCAMYELGSLVIPEALIGAQAGEPLSRSGNAEPGALVSGVFRCADEHDWLAVSVADDAMLRTLLQVVEGVPAGGLVDREFVHAHLATWLAGRRAADAAETFQSHGIPAAPVAGVRELLLDPQYMYRGFFEWVSMKHDERPVLGRPYTWHGKRPPRVRGRAPLFGEHNDTILFQLGVSEDDVNALRAQEVVVDNPRGPRQPRPTDIEAMIRAGFYQERDSRHHEVLARARRADRERRTKDESEEKTT